MVVNVKMVVVEMYKKMMVSRENGFEEVRCWGRAIVIRQPARKRERRVAGSAHGDLSSFGERLRNTDIVPILSKN